MQTLTVNSKYDVKNNSIDYDLLFEELELCFKSCDKTYYIKPKALVAMQLYNKNGKAIKRASACLKYYGEIFENRYSKVLVDAMGKRGFEFREASIAYIDRKSVKANIPGVEKVNEYMLSIRFDRDKEKPSLLKFKNDWEEEIKKIFPTACKFKFVEDVTQYICFTIPEFE